MAAKKQSNTKTRPKKASRPRKQRSLSKPVVLAELPKRDNFVAPVWVDVMRISARGDTAVATLVFDTVLAERAELVETVRIQVTLSLVEQMSEILSNTMKHLLPDDAA